MVNAGIDSLAFLSLGLRRGGARTLKKNLTLGMLADNGGVRY